jgi:hypothetical protein
MVVLANLLLLVSGLLLAIVTLSATRTGPEGPVGAHMVTAPLALGQVAGVGFAVGLDRLAPVGLPALPWFLLLPGLLTALTLLPILALDRRWRPWCRLAVLGAIAGGLLLLDGASLAPGLAVLPFAGGAFVAAVALVGYAILGSWWLQAQRNHVAAARADVERQDAFAASQAAWQLGEWQKLPADPGLWQLIQFTHAFHPEVKAQCHARLAALPDLDARMDELLGTGWAEHALPYLRDFYPRSRAPLAAALSVFYMAACAKWRTSLHGAERPESWYYNLLTYVDVAEKVATDGGDMRACMDQWAKMLHGRRGLEPLAARARRLAAAAG